MPQLAGEQLSPNTVRLSKPTRAWVHLRVTDPLVAWLTYRGVLESVSQAGPHALSLWLLGTLRSSITEDPWFSARETQIESSRLNRNPQSVSRLKGVFAFPDRETADRAVKLWNGFQPYFLQEIEVRAGSTVSYFDSQWIDAMGTSTPPSREWADSYATGAAHSDDPQWELLIDGKADLIGTELRQKAYNVVRATWPEAVAPLEISRLGAQLDSTIGYITAFGVLDGDSISVQFAMDFRDAENPDFTKRLGAHLAALPPDQVNSADLAVGGDYFRVPDLRSRSLSIPLASWPLPTRD